jgi:hypothetical protein
MRYHSPFNYTIDLAAHYLTVVQIQDFLPRSYSRSPPSGHFSVYKMIYHYLDPVPGLRELSNRPDPGSRMVGVPGSPVRARVPDRALSQAAEIIRLLSFPQSISASFYFNEINF